MPISVHIHIPPPKPPAMPLTVLIIITPALRHLPGMEICRVGNPGPVFRGMFCNEARLSFQFQASFQDIGAGDEVMRRISRTQLPLCVVLLLIQFLCQVFTSSSCFIHCYDIYE